MPRSHAGYLEWKLCPQNEHLVEKLAEKIEDLDFLGDPNTNLEVLRNVLKAVRDATYLVIEPGYVDLDQRSELRLLTARQFGLNAGHSARLHFFSEWPDPAQHLALPHRLRAVATSYLGYTTLRNTTNAHVGRTLLPPPRQRRATARAERRNSFVRTTVFGLITVYGTMLRASGVPFLQPDHALTECAHVSAWGAHYSFILRGLAPRRPIADFISYGTRSIDEPAGMYGGGISGSQISDMLTSLGLATRMFDAFDLAFLPQLLPFDRPKKFQSNLRSAELLDEAQSEALKGLDLSEDKWREVEELRAFWLRENLTTTVCRYLNPGFPVIWYSSGHSFLISGYRRSRDELKTRRSGDSSELASFVVSDGDRGPYERKEIDSLVREMHERGQGRFQVLLPHGVWLPAATAEELGADTWINYLETSAISLKETLGQQGLTGNEWRDAAVSLREVRTVASNLEGVMKRTQLPGCTKKIMRADYTLRTYAVASDDFKMSFTERLASNLAENHQLQERIATLRMPQYCWVVEILERSSRNRDMGAVVGEIVIDASVVDETHARKPILTHVPGHVFIGTDGMEQPYRIASSRYRSGRWHADKNVVSSAERALHRFKSAVPPRVLR